MYLGYKMRVKERVTYRIAINAVVCVKSVVVFCVLLTVHLGSVLVNNQLDAHFFFSYIFTPIIYMFRAPLCSTSGQSIVLIRHLVYVTVCR